MRTPIAELRTLTEVALKWPDDPAAAQSALKDALAIALQMEAIATGLMALARCESRQIDVKPEPVPLRELISETSQAFAGKARDRKLALQIDVPSASCWRADRAALRSIVTNLLANAVEYDEPNTTVKVGFEKNGAGERLCFPNINRELAPGDVAHLFDRFWRKDPARSSAEHSGLSLALARAYSDSLGMKLEAKLDRAEVIFTLSGTPPTTHQL